MQSLLRWGIENSTNDGPNQPPPPRKDLDPAIIDHILGKPDSVLMQNALAVAVDDERGEDERVDALDNLEMLIENIDNANDLGKLNMWKPLQDLLTSPSVPDAIKMQTLWVIGTAIQNNPSAQNAYLSISPLPDLLVLLSPSNSHQTRSKTVYALSGLLKHNSAAVEAFSAADGWARLRTALEDSAITVRRKTVFLINSLLAQTLSENPSSADGQRHVNIPSTVHANSHASMLSDPGSTDTSSATLKALREQGLLSALISALTTPVPHGADGESERDVDLEEKILRLLHTYSVACPGQLLPEEKRELQRFLEEPSNNTSGQASLGERWGISSEEMDELKLACS